MKKTRFDWKYQKGKVSDRKGMGMELALLVLFVVFACSILLVSTAMLGRSNLNNRQEQMAQRFELDQFAEQNFSLPVGGTATGVKYNAKRNSVDNAEFFCGDAGEAALSLEAQGIKADVVVVDPPRKGLNADAIEALARFAPRRIVYVSCDPATLARDVALLKERGYALKNAMACDLFPRCAHIESVVCLSREKADDCEDEPKMISDERSKYKSWSNLKKQMNDLLCDSLKDKISYFYTSYHEVHNAYGRATINYNKKEMVAFSWVEMYAQEREVSQLYQEGKKVSYGELEKGKWIPECKLCDADFINSLTIYLKTDIAISLHSDNYLLRVFAYMDRRVGKRTLIKIKDDVEKLPDWVKQFYRIRCEADGIIFPPKRITDETVCLLEKSH